MTEAQKTDLSLKVVSSLSVTANKHKFRGIAKTGKTWQANIGSFRKGTRRYLGHFATPEEAAQAYDNAAVALYGEDAFLNFPLSAAEKKVILSRREEGLCPHGHRLTDNPVRHVSGRIDCGTCRASFDDRMKARGFVRGRAWVKTEQADVVLAIARLAGR